MVSLPLRPSTALRDSLSMTFCPLSVDDELMGLPSSVSEDEVLECTDKMDDKKEDEREEDSFTTSVPELPSSEDVNVRYCCCFGALAVKSATAVPGKAGSSFS